jgi:hypothetical protein
VPLVGGTDDGIDWHPESGLGPVRRIVDIGSVGFADDKHIDVARR